MTPPTRSAGGVSSQPLDRPPHQIRPRHHPPPQTLRPGDDGIPWSWCDALFLAPAVRPKWPRSPATTSTSTTSTPSGTPTTTSCMTSRSTSTPGYLDRKTSTRVIARAWKGIVQRYIYADARLGGHPADRPQARLLRPRRKLHLQGVGGFPLTGSELEKISTHNP